MESSRVKYVDIDDVFNQKMPNLIRMVQNVVKTYQARGLQISGVYVDNQFCNAFENAINPFLHREHIFFPKLLDPNPLTALDFEFPAQYRNSLFHVDNADWVVVTFHTGRMKYFVYLFFATIFVKILYVYKKFLYLHVSHILDTLYNVRFDSPWQQENVKHETSTTTKTMTASHRLPSMREISNSSKCMASNRE